MDTYNDPNDKALRWSTLREGLTSALHLRNRLDNPKPRTDAMTWGKDVHCCVLEPDRFDRECILLTDPKHVTEAGKVSAKGKAWLTEAGYDAEAMAMTVAQRDTYLRMRDSLYLHEDAAEILHHADLLEHEGRWTETPAGLSIPCKYKFDGIATRLSLAFDLKKISGRGKPISVRHCVSTLTSMFYDVQLCGWYDRGNRAQPKPIALDTFAFLFIEEAAPHDVVVLIADDDMIANAQATAQEALDVYVTAMLSGKWPGVAPKRTVASLPAWRFPSDDDLDADEFDGMEVR